VILAVNALKVAVGEENVADPTGSADGRLLSFMYAYRGNIEGGIAFAETGLGSQSVGIAVSRT